MNNFSVNRSKLKNILEDNQMAVVFSGNPIQKLGDEYFPFTPNRNFYYLTGLDRPKMIYFVYKFNGDIEEYIAIERFDEVKAKWVGAVMLPDEVRQISDIQQVIYLDEFEENISSIIFNKRIQKLYLNLENRDFYANTPAMDFANKISNKYSYITIENLFNIMADFRMVKESWEVENIVKAIDITKDGIYNMMRNSKAGMMEYQIESYFDFALKQHGVKDFAFKTIAASGKNATVLHYSDNNSKTEDGDLILFDVGAQYEYYNGDISRTFPVNGNFTDRQKTIYNIVLEGQQIVIDRAKAGIEFKSLNCILKDYYVKALSKIGLISNAEEVSKYYYHGVSHLLGLETHDVGRHNEGLLKSGMVMTVEPGLYIAEEGIGIRIEDNILIEDNGCRVLSKDIIKTVEDIEDFMK